MTSSLETAWKAIKKKLYLKLKMHLHSGILEYSIRYFSPLLAYFHVRCKKKKEKKSWLNNVVLLLYSTRISPWNQFKKPTGEWILNPLGNILPGPPYRLTYKHLPTPSCPLTVHSSDMRDHSSVHAEQPEIMENHSHDTDDNEQHLQIH